MIGETLGLTPIKTNIQTYSVRLEGVKGKNKGVTLNYYPTSGKFMMTGPVYLKAKHLDFFTALVHNGPHNPPNSTSTTHQMSDTEKEAKDEGEDDGTDTGLLVNSDSDVEDDGEDTILSVIKIKKEKATPATPSKTAKAKTSIDLGLTAIEPTTRMHPVP